MKNTEVRFEFSRRLVAAMLCCLFAFAPLLSGSAATKAIGAATVNNPDLKDRLNLRKTASAKATSLGKYYNGVVVEQLAEEKNGWIKVRIGNLEGYMQTDYLEYGDDAKPVQSVIPAVIVDNTRGKELHLREKRSVSSKSLGLYKNGTKITVLGLTATWAHVKVDEKIGFMLLDRLSPDPEWEIGANTQPKKNSASKNNADTKPQSKPDTPSRSSFRMGSSNLFSKAEIQSAADIVLKRFIANYESNGCTLTDFWYDEVYARELLAKTPGITGNESNNIVIFLDYVAGSVDSAEEGYKAGYTYQADMFVLTRADAASVWEIWAHSPESKHYE
jgi:Bacterial SH3 domain.